ncbi:uncharacterized protein LOC111711939 [Eurytemora carolleeae]|uniref:uncharacterized protein LOC111711939 n=1 Tax=Eurytemora carolleeae TaxID=1294199 RepID=UPI000C76A0A7|nr:uncharacterized protein LOC111711939 [Eurytemora carolleeae]|eukprot:XP_023342190.1 uncharacterized protein LOC111711939 [Eurytemora affinis]
MLTMKGSIGPALVGTPGFNKANTEKPQWSPEEEIQRKNVLTALQTRDEGLAKQITVDKSAPIVSGKVSTPHGWVDVEKVRFAAPNPTNKQTKRSAQNHSEQSCKAEKGVAGKLGPPGLAALLGAPPGGKGRGRGSPAGLGDLFAGGLKPNPGLLRGGAGGGNK